MPKLNQIVAIEKSVKSRVYGEITEMHKLSQNSDLFSGFSKQYRKKDEEGEDYPPELPAPRKKELMSRIEKLSHAVKFAREKANASNAETVSVGKPIFDYLLQ